MTIKRCVVCGEKIVGRRSNAICCSSECSIKRWREATRQWQENNREYARGQAREYYAENKERINETARLWQMKNPEKAMKARLKFNARQALARSVFRKLEKLTNQITPENRHDES